MMEQPRAGVLPSEKEPRETAPAVKVFSSPKVSFVGGILAVLVPLALWFAPLGLERTIQHALAVSAFMIIAWITEAIDHGLAGLIGCYLYWALGVVKFGTAFTGFADDTPWFFLGALLMGAIATKYGFARRIAYLVMLRVGNSYSRILLGLILVDFLMTFVVPSAVARVVIMAAIALGLMKVFQLGPGTNIGRGLFMILTYIANIFDKMLIAGVSAIAARGLIERFGHVEILWSRWFIAFLPCSLITIVAAWRITLWLYPPEKESLPGGPDFFRKELGKLGKPSLLEKKSAFLLLIGLGLWLTDFLHHLPPSMVCLGVGFAALLPPVGVLDLEDLKRVNYLPVFFVAAAVSMGQVLITTKALNVLTDVMFAWMTPLVNGVYNSTITLYWTAFVYHIFLASEVPMLGTSIPLLMNFAIAHGLNPLTLGMVWTFAAGGKIFIYQSTPMIVGYSFGYFDGRDMFRVGFWLTVVEFVILLLLVPLYWPLIGIR